MDREALKRQAGEAAAALVRDGMVVGLGTGSTVRHAVVALGREVQAGRLDVVGIATSRATEEQARGLGIRLSTLAEHPAVDLTIDGADELDARLWLVKGGGGALTREKVVARCSRRMIVVADGAKQVERLGSTFPLPVEVVDFACAPLVRWLGGLGAAATVRPGPGGAPWRSDNGNPVVDARFPDGFADPRRLEAEVEAFPGVVACGLFIGLAQEAFVAQAGGVRRLSA